MNQLQHQWSHAIPQGVFNIPREFEGIKTEGFFPGGVFSLRDAVKWLVNAKTNPKQ